MLITTTVSEICDATHIPIVAFLCILIKSGVMIAVGCLESNNAIFWLSVVDYIVLCFIILYYMHKKK